LLNLVKSTARSTVDAYLKEHVLKYLTPKSECVHIHSVYVVAAFV